MCTRAHCKYDVLRCSVAALAKIYKPVSHVSVVAIQQVRAHALSCCDEKLTFRVLLRDA